MAQDPFHVDDLHPSIRGEPRRPLPSRLSNYEFRSYRRGDRTIILHLRTMLLIETTVSFSMNYLSGVTAELRLPTGKHLPLDGLSFACDAPFPFDGSTMAVEMWIPALTGLRELRPGVGALDLRVGWSILGAPLEARVTEQVLIGRVRGR